MRDRNLQFWIQHIYSKIAYSLGRKDVTQKPYFITVFLGFILEGKHWHLLSYKSRERRDIRMHQNGESYAAGKYSIVSIT